MSRWNNARKYPNFAEIEINLLKKVLEISLPHLPGDLVAVEIEEIPEPHRFVFFFSCDVFLLFFFSFLFFLFLLIKIICK